MASSTVANKYALSVLTPSLMVGLRMLCAGVILTLFYRRKSHRMSFAYFKDDLAVLVGISLLTMLVPALLKAFALKNMLSSKAAFLSSLDPFVTALYAYCFWHEHLTKKKVIGIILGFAGTFILLISSSVGEQSLMAWSVFSYPEIAAIMAMAIGRLGWMFVQQLLRKERYSAPELNGLLMTMSGVMVFVLPFVISAIIAMLALIPFLASFLPLYTFSDAAGFMHTTITPDTNMMMIIYSILHTIIIGNVIGYTMYAGFLKKHSATFVSLAGFSVPLYVYLFGALLLGEPLSLNFLAASCVTFIGLLIFYQDEINRIAHGHWHPMQWLTGLFKKTE